MTDRPKQRRLRLRALDDVPRSLSSIVDPGTFASWDGRRSSAILVGEARVHDRKIAVIAGDFAVAAGTMGVSEGERISEGFERALDEKLPLLAIPSSGGVRVQEGAPALMQMVKTALVARDFRESGLPFLAYLTHPTMGGTLASWASMAHVMFAEPGALIGFAGPRVAEVARGASLPPGSQRAETLLRSGLIDGVVGPEQLREHVQRIVSVVVDRQVANILAERVDSDWHPSSGDRWTSILHSRSARRPGARELLARGATDVTFLRRGPNPERDCLASIARLAGIPAVVIAQDRASTGRGVQMGPEGYQRARWAMGLAKDLRLPVVTIVDTPGAWATRDSEERGLATQISACLCEMVSLPSPTLCVLLGEGAGGGALALVPADRVIAAEHAWLAPIAPEAASAILYRSPDRATDVAARQLIASWDLAVAGITDVVVPEYPSADREPDAFLERVVRTIGQQLRFLLNQEPNARLFERRERYRSIGSGGEN